ncbi:hypothetical protein ACJZ2D_014655 [Fusarium nematophilum]
MSANSSRAETCPEVLELLEPANIVVRALSSEESRHSWYPRFSIFREAVDMPLLRVWDIFSGSKPDEQGDMWARSPCERLDTSAARQYFLTTHVDHEIWKDTPFISFTTSPSAITDLAQMRHRMGKRGAQRVTVIDPRIRIQAGWPVLDYDAERLWYGVKPPVRYTGNYFTDHYLCLWRVKREEIVGHWDWDDLSRNPEWYEKILLPEFTRQRERQMEARQQMALDDQVEDVLSGMSILQLNDRNSSQSPPEESPGASRDSGQGEASGADTDGTVEEVTAVEDALASKHGA